MQQKPAAQKKVFKRECADEIVSFMSAIPISRLPDDKLHVICFLALRLFGLRRQSAMVLLSVPKCTRREAHRQAIAGGHDPNGGGEMGDRVHQGCSIFPWKRPSSRKWPPRIAGVGLPGQHGQFFGAA